MEENESFTENPFRERLAQPNHEPKASERAIVRFNYKSGFEFTDSAGMLQVAKWYVESGFAPAHIKKPQQLIILWAKAAELGVPPMTAVEKMSVIGNKVGPMTELALALIEQRGLLKDTPKVEYSGEGDELTCTVTVQRKGRKTPRVQSFSIRQAKQAQIYRNTWLTYPEPMLYARAMGLALHGVFPDVLCGMYTAEELRDMPEVSSENNKS